VDLEVAATDRAVVDALAGAARAWLATLDPVQRARATFPFDSPERMVWAYVPGNREGLALADMRPGQRRAALQVVEVAMSPRGASEIRAIIALESILGDLERSSGRADWARRDPERYWFAVFGEPGRGSVWSWRIGGHHLAIHLTVAGDRVVGSAPCFLGANPATVPGGPSVGARAIEGEERLARALLTSLAPEQARVAIVDPLAPPDILSGSGPRADVRDIPRGIRHDALDGAQAARLEDLIRWYLERARPEIAAGEWARIAGAGLVEVTFAWAGSTAPGRGHYYAIRGPEFLVEYDNTQDGANHIHAVWRDLANDWGEDLLTSHYRTGHRPG